MRIKRTIRHLLALLTMSGSAFLTYGSAVNESAARATGANFLISKSVAGVSSSADLSLVYTASTVSGGDTLNDYYVYNVNGKKAFVMVSADDIIIPILAFSNTSAFVFSNLSPSTKDWIDGYKNQITAAIQNGVLAKAGTAETWVALQTRGGLSSSRTTATTSVSPLVSTTWDQDGGGTVPYNNLCPNTTVSAGLSVTGCVATAMAQVMKFWNWPTVGCGSHTYYDPYSSSEGTGSDSWNTADYGNTAYDWASMPLTSSNDAVATLMYHAGVSVNMSYSANESGSYVTMLETSGVNSAEYALQTYFHYKPTLKGVLRFGFYDGTLGSYAEGEDNEYYNGTVNIDSIVESSWVSMLQTELNAGRPMLYEGTGTIGGHCWVCDGWETTDDMFHFNWGWSGESDGYFTVDNLAPPALGAGGGGGNFNYDQGVIMGIQPDSFPSNPGNIELLAHLNTTTSTPMQYGTPFSITTKIKNAGSSTFNGAFALQVLDSGDHFVATIDSLTGATVTGGDSTATLTFSCNSYAIIPEIYNSLRVAYKATGSATWTPVANNGSFINYTMIGVLNDTDVSLYDSLHIGSHSIIEGSPLSVTTTIGNQGTADFSGTLRAVLVNTSTGVSFTIQQLTGASIASYYSNTYTFTNSDVAVTPGLYALEIQHEYGGTGSYYTTGSDYFINPVLISVTCDLALGTISGPSSVCSGSTITLTDTAAGGSWSSTGTGIATVGTTGIVRGLTTGTDTIKYSIASTCGSATVTAVVNVEIPPSVDAITGTDTVCTGSSIVLSDLASGGTWSSASTSIAIVGVSGAVIGIAAGRDSIRYTVANSCGSVSEAKEIYVNLSPDAGSISGVGMVCSGNSVILSDVASGGAWSSGNTSIATVSATGEVTSLTAGTDTIKYIVANSCGTAAAYKVVSFAQFPVAGAITGAADTVCIGSGIVVVFSDTATGGAWSLSNAHAIQAFGAVIGSTPGMDTIRYIVSNTCGADTAQKEITIVDCATAVNNVATSADLIDLYPNPAQTDINITSSGKINTVVISNLLGQNVFTGKYNAGDVVISLAQLPSGVYIVKINETKFYKVVKQ